MIQKLVKLAKMTRCLLLHSTHDEFVVATVYGGKSVFQPTITHLQRHTICDKCENDLDAEPVEMNLLEVIIAITVCVGPPVYGILMFATRVLHIAIS